MALQFKEVDSPSDKPAAEIEAEVQKQAQEAEAVKQEAERLETERVEADKVKNKPPEIGDQDVLRYFEKKGRKVASLDELFVDKKQEELNPTVAQLNKYIKETGRGIEDYLKLNRDYSKMDEDDLLKEYLLATEEDVEKFKALAAAHAKDQATQAGQVIAQPAPVVEPTMAQQFAAAQQADTAPAQ